MLGYFSVQDYYNHYLRYIQTQGLGAPSEGFLLYRNAFDAGLSNGRTMFFAREQNVENFYVSGEVVSELRSSSTAIMGSDTLIDMGPGWADAALVDAELRAKLIDHCGTPGASTSLHSSRPVVGAGIDPASGKNLHLDFAYQNPGEVGCRVM